MARQRAGKELEIRAVTNEPGDGPFRLVRLATDRGEIHCHYYKQPGQRLAALFVGGVGGGFDSPAGGMYPRLAEELATRGVATLRMRFRNSRDLAEAVLDVLAGLTLLEGDGMVSMALVGHSFGGAVAIQAASAFPTVRTVVTLASQSYGAEAVSKLGPRCSTLFLHGANDPILPYACSEHLYENAAEPKRIHIYDGAAHGLDEVADQVYAKVRGWILGRLNDEDIEDWRWGAGTEGPSVRE